MTARIWFWIAVIAIPLLALAIAFAVSYRLGSIIVLPEPKNAQVLVDGKEVGFTSRLAPGSYQLTVTAPGYSPHRETLKIRALQIKRIRTSLRKLASAKLVVAEQVDLLSSNPEGDQFFYFNRQAKALFRLRFVEGPEGAKVENIPITPSVLGDLTEVAFAPDYSVAAVSDRTGSSGLYNFARYDLLHQEFKPYDSDSHSFAFDPEGKLIYYRYSPGSEQTLVRSERSRDHIERLIDLKDIGQDARLAISPDGNTILINNGKSAYLAVITTKTISKVADQVSSSVFLGNDRLLITGDGELAIVPFQIVTTGTGKELGTIKLGEAVKLGVRGQASDLAIAADRITGIFEPLDSSRPAGLTQGKQFGSYELTTNRFIGLKLASELPEGSHQFRIDATGKNVVFIAQGKLFSLEL
ncbi:PEGA domain-containing protein [Candidatus Berkelbacteria bacterium]|nr:PEGA domain-containing protein [Candidatus Berkelbacteria bacterium]